MHTGRERWKGGKGWEKDLFEDISMWHSLPFVGLFVAFHTSSLG